MTLTPDDRKGRPARGRTRVLTAAIACLAGAYFASIGVVHIASGDDLLVGACLVLFGAGYPAQVLGATIMRRTRGHRSLVAPVALFLRYGPGLALVVVFIALAVRETSRGHDAAAAILFVCGLFWFAIIGLGTYYRYRGSVPQS